MIKSLTLQNFRSWEEGYIEFSPNITILLGENDNGKTNILRAINLIVNNRPLGEDFRSNWGGDTKVSVEIDDKIITRVKTNNDNYYTMTGYKEPFRAFNKGVPEPIKQFINFSDVNVGFQLDGPFLLSKSPSDVAKYYNEAVNLDIIDRSISNIKATLREEKSQKTKIEFDITKCEKDLEKLLWLDDVEPKIESLEKLQKNIQNKNIKFSVLSELIQSYHQQEKQLISLNKIIIFESLVKQLKVLHDTFLKSSLDYWSLKDSAEKIKDLDSQEKEINVILSFENKVNKLIQIDQEIEAKTSKYNELGKFIVEIKGYGVEEIEANKKIKNEKLLNSLLEINQKIEDKTFEYNELLDHVEKIKNYDSDFEYFTLQIFELDKEYKEILPEVCPVLEIECQKLIEIKRGK